MSGDSMMYDISTLDPVDFEILIALLFEKMGYKTKWVGQARDRGADVLAFKDGENILIQAKHTKVRRPITEVAVGDPRRAKTTYEMKYNTTFKLALITNHTFSEGCYPYAQEGDEVFLWDSEWLSQQMKDTRFMLSAIRSRRSEK